MDKLIKLAVEIRLNDTKISQIERQCYNGEISSEKAFDLVIEACKQSDKKIKAILNEPVKVGKSFDEQFMDDRQVEALNIN